MKGRKKICLFMALLTLVFGSTLTAYAYTHTYNIEIASNQAVNSAPVTVPSGRVTFTLKASNNSNCHYYCTIAHANGSGVITTVGPVLGNGNDTKSVTVNNVVGGGYYAFIRPINGSTNGRTVTCTLTIRN